MINWTVGVAGILSVLATQLYGQQLNGPKVHVAIYYESLCPDSINFIQYQLKTQYPYFADAINLQFVPFGKSSSLQRGSVIDFRCQHGPEECAGNKVQSCALNAITTQQEQVQFVGCQMQYGADSSGQSCAGYSGVPYDYIPECIANGLGVQLQLEAETDTKNVAHPRKQLPFVPTIVYNYEFDALKQERSLYDLQGVLCDEIELIGAPAPDICLQRG